MSAATEGFSARTSFMVLSLLGDGAGAARGRGRVLPGVEAFELVAVEVGVVGVDAEDLGEVAVPSPALDVNEVVERGRDVGFDRGEGHLDARLQHEGGEAREGPFRAVRVDGRHGPAVSRVQGLEEVVGGAVAYLADDDAVRPVPEGGFQEL